MHFKQYEFDALPAGVERGDFDFAMNGLEDIAEPSRDMGADHRLVHLFERPAFGEWSAAAQGQQCRG